ncbi:hypothetical protein VKT23_011591 [Stygiomarasmius scandens]|uniref:Uncharacterized protein n=1 Tax=Marasmiellus scandens TaxID=2682957 RepID=A0ABR1JB87_9AGAR
MSGSEAQSVLTSADAKAVEAFIIAEAIEGICYGIEAVLTISVCYILITAESKGFPSHCPDVFYWQQQL